MAEPNGEPQATATRHVTPSAAARIEPTVPQSFESIEEHVGAVYRYALRLTGRADLADDLTQETFLRGCRQWRNVRDERAARVWLLRIATNLWTDELRKKRSQPSVLVTEPPCPRRPPAAATEDRENVAAALSAIDELPPRQRQVIYLVTCEGFSLVEVSDVLGLSTAAVKSNLSLARKEIRRRLKDLYDEVCGRTCEQND
jgi:RNA polymerase sigma-70 factor (ECF subfamily)